MGTCLAHTPRSRCHPQMGRRYRLARPAPHKPPPKQLGLTLHQLFLSFNPRPAAHPRSRRENFTFKNSLNEVPGSSPLARGKPCDKNYLRGPGRIIPACAGKTSSARSIRFTWWDHPCLRGENAVLWPESIRLCGSSLLARGKLSAGGVGHT